MYPCNVHAHAKMFRDGYTNIDLIFLVASGVLAETVEKGENAGPVLEDVPAAGGQLGHEAVQGHGVPVAAAPDQVLADPLHHRPLPRPAPGVGVAVTGAAGQQLEA